MKNLKAGGSAMGGDIGKRRLAKVTSVFLMLVLALSLMGYQTLGAGTASISGKVTDASSGQPLDNVVVSIWIVDIGGNASWVKDVTTISDGTYFAGDLSAGNYKVYFYPQGGNYVDQWYNGKSDIAFADLISVADGASVVNIDAALQVGAIISGTVTDDSSTPAPLTGVSVKAEPVDGSGNLDVSRSSKVTTTDLNGNYSIAGLQGGFYKVSFNLQSSGYALQYYNDTQVFSAADIVAATPGNTTPNINARLHKGGSISGRVTDDALPPPNPKGYALVKAIPVDAAGVRDSGRPEISTRTNPDGTYAILGLAPGYYKVYFLAEGENLAIQYYNDKWDFGAADSINVSAGSSSSGVDARLHPGGIFTGTVTSGGSPVPAVTVSAIPVDASGNRDSDRDQLTAQTDIDGIYAIMGLTPGNYKVIFDGMAQGYEPQYYNAKATFATADIVIASSGSTASGINANLNFGSSISGRVTDDSTSTPQPINGVTVKAIPVDAGGNLDPSRLEGSSTTNINGDYVISGLAAGNYKVHFDASGLTYTSQYYNDKISFN